MRIKITNVFKSITKAFVLVMLFYSCTSKKKQTSTIKFNEVAQGIGYEVLIKHTDSGRLAATLKTKVLKDYTHLTFPYYEFPEGIELTVYDKKGGKSKIFSDYAIQYDKTKLVDLQGNVHIVTADSVILDAPQLYWNQGLHWVYTDNPYDVRFSNGAKNKGSGFDASEDFSTFKSRTNEGIQVLEE